MSGTEIVSAARMALATIWEHKMRSFLTVLGVIIGTGTVIGVGSIITGMDASISNIFRSFGPTTLIAFKFKIGFRFNISREEAMRKPLTVENAVAIMERCEACKNVSPYLFPDFRSIHLAKYKGNEIYNVEMGGTEEAYAAGGTTMKFGRFISDTENRHHLPVCVIGEDIQKSWFAGMDPVGKRIEVDGHELEIVGAMDRPAASFPGQEDLRVLLPYFTMKKMYPSARENMLVIVAYDGKVAEAMDEVHGILRQERRLKQGAADNFDITTAEQMVEEFRNMMSVTALVMVILSSIGLLVGGVGVMNIMLVSVTERTREIGVRKAMGARKRDILVQFTLEAVMLTAVGGVIGLLLGALITAIVPVAFPSLPATMSMYWSMFAFVASAAVGLIFGIYPAWKAANLDPIESLRYE
jgi:putative ABC transport system permease protein